MRAWTLLVLAVGVASTAQAQVTLLVDGQTSVSVSNSSCAATLRVRWTNSSVTAACGSLKIWVTNNSCGDDLDTSKGDVLVTQVATADFLGVGRTNDATIAVSSLPIFNTADAGGCGTLQAQSTMQVCGSFKQQQFVSTGTTCNFIQASTSPSITFDSLPPKTPTINSVTGRDSALSVNISAADNDTSTYEISFAVAGTDNFTSISPVSRQTTTTDANINGLENGVTYEVRVSARDAAGNVSTGFASSTGTPIATLGFGDLCEQEGCTEKGGCQTAGGPLMAMMAFSTAGLIWLRLRRRS